jgi:hypothetical protein
MGFVGRKQRNINTGRKESKKERKRIVREEQ